MMEGRLVIISAPSGAGKTTIVRYLLDCGFGLEFSVSATTRQRRENEIDGKDYYFLTKEEFRRRISAGEFAEWEEVYKDNLYGTLKAEIERIWAKGRHVLFDVDVKGGLSLKKIYRDKAISVFIMPPSVGELENRLIARGTDKSETIRMRIEKAAEEIRSAKEFDHIVVNDDLEKAKAEVFNLVKKFLNTGDK